MRSNVQQTGDTDEEKSGNTVRMHSFLFQIRLQQCILGSRKDSKHEYCDRGVVQTLFTTSLHIYSTLVLCKVLLNRLAFMTSWLSYT